MFCLGGVKYYFLPWFAKYSYIENEEFNYDMYIDEILLTYAIEPIKDTKNEYMLLPVWAFYGGYDYGEGIVTDDGKIFSGKFREPRSLLTINAIDGSIILGQ